MILIFAPVCLRYRKITATVVSMSASVLENNMYLFLLEKLIEFSAKKIIINQCSAPMTLKFKSGINFTVYFCNLCDIETNRGNNPCGFSDFLEYEY